MYLVLKFRTYVNEPSEHHWEHNKDTRNINQLRTKKIMLCEEVLDEGEYYYFEYLTEWLILNVEIKWCS